MEHPYQISSITEGKNCTSQWQGWKEIVCSKETELFFGFFEFFLDTFQYLISRYKFILVSKLTASAAFLVPGITSLPICRSSDDFLKVLHCFKDFYSTFHSLGIFSSTMRKKLTASLLQS